MHTAFSIQIAEVFCYLSLIEGCVHTRRSTCQAHFTCQHVHLEARSTPASLDILRTPPVNHFAQAFFRARAVAAFQSAASAARAPNLGAQVCRIQQRVEPGDFHLSARPRRLLPKTTDPKMLELSKAFAVRNSLRWRCFSLPKAFAIRNSLGCWRVRVSCRSFHVEETESVDRAPREDEPRSAQIQSVKLAFSRANGNATFVIQLPGPTGGGGHTVSTSTRAV